MKQIRKVLFAGMAGNALEFYDFSLYGVFSVVIAKTFFPPSSQLTSLLFVFLAFALGYVTRPIGAILFGQLGDSLGRKKALSLSVLCMALSTLLIGVLPSYESIGILAPILLVSSRLLQGISSGGEYNGAAIFMIEHMPNHKALAGAMTTISASIGVLLAMIMGNLTLKYSVFGWEWRLPFFTSIALGGIGFYIRQKVEETPDFKIVLEKRNTIRVPLLEVLKKHSLAVVCCIGGAAFVGAMTSMPMAFLPTYLSEFVGVSRDFIFSYVSVGICVLIVFSPCFGYLADRFGSEKIMLGGAIGIIFCAPIIFKMLQMGEKSSILGALVLMHMLMASFVPIFNAFINDLFPTHVRYSGITLGYGIGMSFFGGTTPMISTFLIEKTSSLNAPSLYLTFVSLFAILSIFIGKTIKKKNELTYAITLTKEAA